MVKKCYKCLLRKILFYVYTKEITLLITSTFLVLIASIIFFLNSFVLYSSLFITYCCLFLFNIISVVYFRTYLPLCLCLYSSSIVTLLMIFIKLSYLSYRNNYILFLATQEYEKNYLRKTILSIMSHNLNTPLAQVQGLFDLIRISLSESTQKNSTPHPIATFSH